MQQRGSGLSIANVRLSPNQPFPNAILDRETSTAARKTVPGQSIYSCTGAAVLALSDGLRQELAGKLRVTVISPGFTDTDFVAHVKDEALRSRLEQAGATFAMPAEAIAQAIGYAIDQPESLNVGEIILRSTAQA